MVNDEAFEAEARLPDPQRLVAAYQQSASTLNLLRAFTKGGFADLSQVHLWNQQFVSSSVEGQRYERIASEIDRALRFMAACGIDLGAEQGLHQVDFFTSHEALILPYEECLTRVDSLTGDWYDCSAHMVWIGDRTHQLDGAHVEFMSGINNPIGCKIGPSSTPAEVVALCERLNPDRIPGRLTLITRFGAERVATLLPPIVRSVEAEGHAVVWTCDPMHGNTFTSEGGRKTRRFDDILSEVKAFFDVHRDEGTWPGGVHVELTGDNVTECLGGAEEILEGDLGARYTTTCDPRLTRGNRSIWPSGWRSSCEVDQASGLCCLDGGAASDGSARHGRGHEHAAGGGRHDRALLLVGGLRRRDLQLRRCSVLRQPGARSRQADRRHGGTPDGGGYWLVASDGGIFSYGDARFYGSTGRIDLNKPVVGMAPTPDGGATGSWRPTAASSPSVTPLLRLDRLHGPQQAHRRMASTPDGKGYWLVASDGGIFTFGDAQFYGSTGGSA